ncbi:fumarylacetoacetate hydrolase family protein [Streptosporangium sp. NPDC050855]|uniref:fumarylacetoacetate hydrolase family protein n=1 Tax=Streptosporangium sp. NPDC050855 TaxID=3366194 RepID=UPI00378AFB3D
MHIVRYRRDRRSPAGVGVLREGRVVPVEGAETVAALLRLPLGRARDLCEGASGAGTALEEVVLLPPVDGRTEVWAAGVTYQNSRLARMEESLNEADVYERVYHADRPELFFKAVAWKVVGDGEPIAVRADSAISVPEPEAALVLNSAGEMFGLTVCDDVSSRSLEAENPLYLPQAKIYDGACALGPAIRPAWEVEDPGALTVELSITRAGHRVWHGSASTAQLNRGFAELAGYLFRDNTFADGAVLSTGTCLVPDLPFTLEPGDLVEIGVAEVGTLRNTVVRGAGDHARELERVRSGTLS